MVTMSFFFSFFITYLSNVSCFIHIKPISIESPWVTRLLRDSGTTLGSVYTMPEVAFQESKLCGGDRSLSEHARLTLYIWIFFLGLGRTPSPICINKKAKNKTKHTPPLKFPVIINQFIINQSLWIAKLQTAMKNPQIYILPCQRKGKRPTCSFLLPPQIVLTSWHSAWPLLF